MNLSALLYNSSKIPDSNEINIPIRAPISPNNTPEIIGIIIRTMKNKTFLNLDIGEFILLLRKLHIVYHNITIYLV